MKCPFCGLAARAEHVDIGVGMQRIEPWGCDSCLAFETSSKEEYENCISEGFEGDTKSGWIKHRRKRQKKVNEMNTVPGEFVTDELGRIIVSYSSLRAFRSCRRKFKRRYKDHLVPLELRPGDPRQFGKSIHVGREALSRGMNVDDILVNYWGDVERDHTIFEERERARAMMRNYRRRWSVESQAEARGKWILLETKFTGDIIDPRTGAVHKKYAAGGKVDGALDIKEPCLWGSTEIEPGKYLYELKSAGRVDGTYIRKLWLDFQILWYSHYVEDGLQDPSCGILKKGEPLKGVLYDIVEKTKMAHTEEETEAEFEARWKPLMKQAQAGELCKSEKGGTIKKRKDEPDDVFRIRCVEGATKWVENSVVRTQRETDESYRARLDKSYENDERFHRVVVPISVEHREDIRVNVWELLWQHDEAEARGHYGKNEDACFGFFRACDYLPICKSLDSEIEINNNFRLKTPHSEQVESDLPVVA